MQVLKTIPMTATYKGNDVVADAQSNLYIVGSSYLYKMNAAGTVLNHITLAGTDIKISTDGKLLVAQGNRTIELDENLNILGFFDNGGSVYGSTFVSWDTYQAPTIAPTTGTLSGSVFADLNGNGTRQSNEAGLSGWLVYVDANNYGQLSRLKPTSSPTHREIIPSP